MATSHLSNINGSMCTFFGITYANTVSLANMNKRLRISLLLVIDVVFAFLELITGYAVNSLALIADSFHMFNDILSLLVALWAVHVSNAGRDETFTYGMQRAEILGALINGVFLLALCVTILLEAIQRFIEVPVVKSPKMILIVGFLGLLSNIVGLFLFHEHGHSHGHTHGHGHSHGSNLDLEYDGGVASLMPENALSREEARLLGPGITANYGANLSNQENIHAGHNHARKPNESHGHQKSMNMEGVFLHVLGDALGNIGVIGAALFIWKTSFSWRYYADPLISLVITCIIIASAVPLTVRASRVLLQATPGTVNTLDVHHDLESIPGIQDIHDLHIWQLSESRIVGTVHVTVNLPSNQFSELATTIQECFSAYGVPSVTIQPEFVEATSNPPAGVRQCQSRGNLIS